MVIACSRISFCKSRIFLEGMNEAVFFLVFRLMMALCTVAGFLIFFSEFFLNLVSVQVGIGSFDAVFDNSRFGLNFRCTDCFDNGRSCFVFFDSKQGVQDWISGEMIFVMMEDGVIFIDL